MLIFYSLVNCHTLYLNSTSPFRLNGIEANLIIQQTQPLGFVLVFSSSSIRHKKELSRTSIGILFALYDIIIQGE